MKIKPIVVRAAAHNDVLAAIDYYRREASPRVALGFVDAVERAYQHISRQPASGSPHYGQELDLPGVRGWSVTGFPWLVFYIEHSRRVDILRVLHGERDIPASLRSLP